MCLKDKAYFILIILIEYYKWIQYKTLQIFESQVRMRVLKTLASVGVVVDIEGENQNEKKISGFDEDYVSKKSMFKTVVKLKVHDEKFFVKVACNIIVGLGDGYIDGVWDSNNISEIVRRVYRAKIVSKYFESQVWSTFLNHIELNLFNLQTMEKAGEVATKHYDLGNDLFKSFLDPWMNYSCGYWAKADNLVDAQIHKMQLIANKLLLKRGMSVLDIGCGFGGLCKFLAKNYGVKCVGITISEEQATYGKELCKELPVDIRLEDYRMLNEKFDRIVSLEMVEHVGIHNFRKYFEVVERCLKDDGIFILQCSGINHKNMFRNYSWFHKNLFPNYCIPYCKDIIKYTEGLFIIEDWHNFGSLDYPNTFQSWIDNFDMNWPTISIKYGDKFYRKWTFYLQVCKGIMQSRMSQSWQIVLSKDGLDKYRAAR